MSQGSLSDYVSVYRAKGHLQGEMIKAFLEAQDLHVILSQEAAGTVYGLTVGDLGTAEILVPQDEQEQALHLLHAMEDGEYAEEILLEDSEPEKSLGPHSEPDESELKNRKKVLILCTGNSARSQIAEAVVNTDCWENWVAYSAGTEPAGYIHPLALEVLAEAGIYHQGESKSVDVFREQSFDLIITVCDHARETCPIWLGTGNRIHIGFEDPAAASGTESEKKAFFQQTLELIRAAIPAVLKQYT